MAEEMPPPLTQLAAAAAEHHELFSAWVGAGFTRGEALDLLKGALAMAMGIGLVTQAQQPPPAAGG